MLRRYVRFAFRGYVRGVRYRFFRSSFGAPFRIVSLFSLKPEKVDLLLKPGDRFVIEHLDVTQKQQDKDMKRARKADKRLAKGRG